MGRPLKIAKSNTVDIGIPSQTEIGNIGVVGGSASAVSTLLVVANINYNGSSYAEGNSYIVRQKGEFKYLVANVANSAIQGIVYLVNVTGTSIASLQGGQMAIIAKDAANANITIGKLDNNFCIAYADQSANAGVKANMVLGQPYWTSFVAANATVQPGSAGGQNGGPDGGGAPGGGLYPIVKLPSF